MKNEGIRKQRRPYGLCGPVRGSMCIFMEWILNCGRTTNLWNSSTQLSPGPLRESRRGSCDYSPIHSL